MRAKHGAVASWCLVVAALAGCERRPAPPIATHLVDLFRPELVEGRSNERASLPARSEWRFDEASAKAGGARGWEAGPGVAALEVRGGRLQGRSTAASPILHLERRDGFDSVDTVDAVEVRLRVSAGANLGVAFSGQEKVDLAEIAKQPPSFWVFSTPVLAGEDLRTYVMSTTRGIPLSRTRHVLLKPTDAAGARFEIESVRIVSRKEQLASVPSGIGWQGLSEIYRECVVARTPETIRYSLTLPERPQLDLAVGTIEDEPVSFRASIASGDRGSEELLLERTLTTPHRWEPVPLDLRKHAGRRVTLSLSLTGGKPGLLGFWGGPIVRSLGAAPRTAAPARTAGEPPRGVILIWVDTLRRDHLDAYGYRRETGPVVRRMASEGMLFRDALVQATWTKVSTPSVLTSLYPTSHGVQDFSDRLPSSAVTLAEVYREAGYATLSMSSVLFTGRFTNLHQGFDEVQENGSIKGEGRMSKTARIYVDRLLAWLEAHRDAPFFVFLHVQDPHDPYKPRAPFDTLWAHPALEDEHERQMKEVRKVIADPLLKLFVMPTRDDLRKAGFDPEAYVAHERDWYDGSIRGMDVEIGRLLEGLRQMRLDRGTLVVYTSDHGEEFLEHGRMFHGQSTYGELSAVPLILWQPGTIPAAVAEETVQSIDIMPTLLELSRLPIPAGVQGHSLLPLLEAAAASTAKDGVRAASKPATWPAVVEKAVTRETGGTPPRDTESFAIVWDGWKLIHNTRRASGRPEYELYDHRNDPLDQKDVAAEHAEVVARLSKDLKAWRAKAEAARLESDATAAQGMSSEELERLRALGYIQ